MILSRSSILNAISLNKIVIAPFNEANLGPNSYDVHLGKTLAVYEDHVLDCKKYDKIRYIDIPDDGYVLRPGELYLGVTQEYTETRDLVPFLEGKSSLGRKGISVHVTAGKGDVGFCGNWTLEITCIRPIRIYAGMPVAQLIYHEITRTAEVAGDVDYCNREQSKYKRGKSNYPQNSLMHLNFT